MNNLTDSKQTKTAALIYAIAGVSALMGTITFMVPIHFLSNVFAMSHNYEYLWFQHEMFVRNVLPVLLWPAFVLLLVWAILSLLRIKGSGVCRAGRCCVLRDPGRLLDALGAGRGHWISPVVLRPR